MYRALARWDGLSVRGSDARYTEPGTVIMQTWRTNMFSLTLRQVLPASVYPAFSDPGYPTRSAPYITHSKNSPPHRRCSTTRCSGQGRACRRPSASSPAVTPTM